MNSIAVIKPPPVETPTFVERVAEYMPWIGFVFVAGPPVLFLVVPCLVLALSLLPAFAFLVTLVAALIALMVVAVCAGALIATPYLMIRRVRIGRRVRSDVGERTAHVVAVGSREATA